MDEEEGEFNMEVDRVFTACHHGVSSVKKS